MSSSASMERPQPLQLHSLEMVSGNRVWGLYGECYVIILPSLSLCLSVSVCLSVCLFVFLFVFLSLSVCLSICLSLYLSVSLSVCLSICLSLGNFEITEVVPVKHSGRFYVIPQVTLKMNNFIIELLNKNKSCPTLRPVANNYYVILFFFKVVF